jgi:hypothetical protein
MLSILSFGTSAPAFAGCPSTYSKSACEIWKRQQNAPALKGPKTGATEPMRCVAVLQNEVSALALRKGAGNKGAVIVSWRKATLNWKQTSRGYETTVCFPVRYVTSHNSLTLCGARGHSSWGQSELSYLRRSNVGSNDPACTGGTGWCAARGL